VHICKFYSVVNNTAAITVINLLKEASLSPAHATCSPARLVSLAVAWLDDFVVLRMRTTYRSEDAALTALMRWGGLTVCGIKRPVNLVRWIDGLQNKLFYDWPPTPGPWVAATPPACSRSICKE
jgi:hypothetical protein